MYSLDSWFFVWGRLVWRISKFRNEFYVNKDRLSCLHQRTGQSVKIFVYLDKNLWVREWLTRSQVKYCLVDFISQNRHRLNMNKFSIRLIFSRTFQPAFVYILLRRKLWRRNVNPFHFSCAYWEAIKDNELLYEKVLPAKFTQRDLELSYIPLFC